MNAASAVTIGLGSATALGMSALLAGRWAALWQSAPEELRARYRLFRQRAPVHPPRWYNGFMPVWIALVCLNGERAHRWIPPAWWHRLMYLEGLAAVVYIVGIVLYGAVWSWRVLMAGDQSGPQMRTIARALLPTMALTLLGGMCLAGWLMPVR